MIWCQKNNNIKCISTFFLIYRYMSYIGLTEIPSWLKSLTQLEFL